MKTVLFAFALFTVCAQAQPQRIPNNLHHKYQHGTAPRYFAQAPSSDGKPPIIIIPPLPPQPTSTPPPVVIVPMPQPPPPPLPTNPPALQYYMDKYAMELQTALVPNGKWQVVCQNFYCGATNNVFPLGTNTLIIPSLGGRTVERWLRVQCPTCQYGFTNRVDQIWVMDIPPVPVLVTTNISSPSPAPAPRRRP